MEHIQNERSETSNIFDPNLIVKYRKHVQRLKLSSSFLITLDLVKSPFKKNTYKMFVLLV